MLLLLLLSAALNSTSLTRAERETLFYMLQIKLQEFFIDYLFYLFIC